MDLLDYLTEKESEQISGSIHSQIISLKELIENKENFKEKDDWKEVSFITEGDGND